MRTALNKMGLCSNFPIAMAYQTQKNGGLGFPIIFVSAGLARLNNFVSHIRLNRTIGKILQNILSHYQLEVGTSEFFLKRIMQRMVVTPSPPGSLTCGSLLLGPV